MYLLEGGDKTEVLYLIDENGSNMYLIEGENVVLLVPAKPYSYQ